MSRITPKESSMNSRNLVPPTISATSLLLAPKATRAAVMAPADVPATRFDVRHDVLLLQHLECAGVGDAFYATAFKYEIFELRHRFWNDVVDICEYSLVL